MRLARAITWHMGKGHANVRSQKNPGIRRTTRPTRAGRVCLCAMCVWPSMTTAS